MNELYPLKFTPIYKETIWGGNKLVQKLGKNIDATSQGSHINKEKIGETWEISSVQENISVVENGFLAENTLQELVEIYMGDLIGDKIYEKFGIEFPLLIKFIDANAPLSIQVHPNDITAKKRHKAFGKNEMWYVVEADENAEIIIGFNQEIDKEKYLKVFENKQLEQILNKIKVKAGDVFYLPAGRVHSIGEGILIAEIQQTSDITYRIYDWERLDSNGKSRELHVDFAKDTIDFSFYENYKIPYSKNLNTISELASCNYFTVNILDFNKPKERTYVEIDSFVIFMCLEGEFEIDTNQEDKTKMIKGESVLIPAEIDSVNLIPKQKAKILEIYVDM